VISTNVIWPPAASTRCAREPGNSGLTVRSGVKVKMSEVPAVMASPITSSQIRSRWWMKSGEPKGKMAISRSTSRWLWKSVIPVSEDSSLPTVYFPAAGGPWRKMTRVTGAPFGS